jgi:hypothetical protein
VSALWCAVLLFAVSDDAANSPQLDSTATQTTEKIGVAIDRANIRSDADSKTSSDPKADSNEPLFPPRKPAEMRTAVSNAMRATATAKDPAARDLAIRKLILIMLELEQDQNLTHDERVELRTLVHSRLTALEKTLRAEAEREKKPAPTSNKPAAQLASQPVSQQPSPTNAKAQPSVAANKQPVDDAKVQAVGQTTEVLGQMVNVQGGNRGFAAANPTIGSRNQAIGGVGGQNIGQQQADSGPDLVSLIQTVIAPRTWDVNGGPGSVVYYRNLQALVIRAPSDVHGQVGDALGQLRK